MYLENKKMEKVGDVRQQVSTKEASIFLENEIRKNIEFLRNTRNKTNIETVIKSYLLLKIAKLETGITHKYFYFDSSFEYILNKFFQKANNNEKMDLNKYLYEIINNTSWIIN